MRKSILNTTTGIVVVLVLLISFSINSIGCGPIQSTSLIHEATIAVEAAKIMDGDQFAPYEYWMSVNMLHKAKEEWGYSDFEAATDFAQISKDKAIEARKIAKDSPLRGKPIQDNPIDDEF